MLHRFPRQRFLPRLLGLLLLLVILSRPAGAQYGYGEAYWQQSDPSYSFTQTPTGSGWAPYGSNGYSKGDSVPFGGALSGTVTITFTWNGGYNNEPAPKNVIVTENMEPFVNSFTGGGGTSSVDTGLSNNAPTRYEVKDSSSGSFTVTSPVMSASVSNWTNSAILGIGMTASVSDVVLSLGGVVSEPAQANILVGQGCAASLSAGPATLSNYQWSVPGDKFASFDMAPDQTWGHATEVSPNEFTKSNPQWYWRKAESVTVSCTAQASVNGQSIGSVTAEREVKIWTPYHGLFDMQIGTPFYNPINNNIASGGDFGLYFDGAVGTQDLFRSQQGAGRFFYVQLVKRSHILSPTFPIYSNSSTNGEFWLDNEWPYSENPDYQDATSTENQRTFLTFSDNPQTGGLLGRHGVSVNDSFKCYMMYEPPFNGVGVQPVTLHRVEWGWTAEATRSIDENGNHSESWEPVPPGTVTVGFNGWSIEHPIWENLFWNP